MGRLHFVMQSVTSLNGTTWIPQLLGKWNSTIYQLTVKACAHVIALCDHALGCQLCFSADQTRSCARSRIASGQ
jgi:hypothetical protein